MDHAGRSSSHALGALVAGSSGPISTNSTAPSPAPSRRRRLRRVRMPRAGRRITPDSNLLEHLGPTSRQVEEAQGGTARSPTPLLPTDGCDSRHVQKSSEHRLADVQPLANLRNIPGLQGLHRTRHQRPPMESPLPLPTNMVCHRFHTRYQSVRIERDFLGFHGRNCCLMTATAVLRDFSWAAVRVSLFAFVYR